MPNTLAAACLGLAMLAWASSAGAAVPATLSNPASCQAISPTPSYTVYRCDDGVPNAGGTNANIGGAKAVTVPAKYDGYARLPQRAADAATVPGADANGDVALDVDVTLPTIPAPQGGYPLLVFMHGCCSGSKTSWEDTSFDGAGEHWHYNDAWFAARGYVVLNYTARGFVNGNGDGSTGETQLDSRDYEINDYQSLACQLYAAAPQFSSVTGQDVHINGRRIVTTGGSYGGGFSWMALTDPRWRCTDDTGAGGTRMSLAATAPKYGWTDLLYSLVPTGTHLQDPKHLPVKTGCDSGPLTLDGQACPSPVTPVGIPKQSIVAGLYASGKTGVPPGSSHTTFPPEIDAAEQCLQGPYPPAPGPLCDDTIANTLPEFLRVRSPYYQNRFFRKIAQRADWRVPVFNAATLTDPLFPASEDRTMLNRLRKAVPDYPIQAYYGDYQHFTQNKPTVWGDVCGAGQNVCTVDDYPNQNFNRDPPTLVRTGVTTRLNRFIDYYAHPPGDRQAPQPAFDVTAELQICNGTDDPGPQFTAPTFEQLAPNTLTLVLSGNQTTTNNAEPNPHATNSDPIANSQSNGGACPVEMLPAGPGVATYDSAPLQADETMIGATKVTALFDVSPGAAGVELNARLYDVAPDGTAVMVDRGPRRVSDGELASGTVSFELHGNGWQFPAGDSIRIELAQDDSPFLAVSSDLSSLTLTAVNLAIPVR